VSIAAYNETLPPVKNNVVSEFRQFSFAIFVCHRSWHPYAQATHAVQPSDVAVLLALGVEIDGFY
jgi:hypothetical protein